MFDRLLGELLTLTAGFIVFFRMPGATLFRRLSTSFGAVLLITVLRSILAFSLLSNEELAAWLTDLPAADMPDARLAMLVLLPLALAAITIPTVLSYRKVRRQQASSRHKGLSSWPKPLPNSFWGRVENYSLSMFTVGTIATIWHGVRTNYLLVLAIPLGGIVYLTARLARRFASRVPQSNSPTPELVSTGASGGSATVTLPQLPSAQLAAERAAPLAQPKSKPAALWVVFLSTLFGLAFGAELVRETLIPFEGNPVPASAGLALVVTWYTGYRRKKGS